MTALGDFPTLRGAPDVDPADCIPSLARKPHGHWLCLAWRRGDLDRRETRQLVREPVKPR